MRIGNAQKYADKILNFVKEMCESDSAIYDKTRDKLIQLGELCSEIQQAISETLETAKPRGFEANSIEKTDAEVTTLNKRVDKVEAKVEMICADQSEPQSTTQKPSQILPHKEEKKSPQKPHITPNDSKKVLHTYAKVLETASTTDHNNAVVNRCCGLLWQWFDTRILNHHKNRKFRYDVRNIKDYIAGFIISFGHHIEHGDFERYADRIEDWIHQDNRYIYPYEVKEICVDKKTKYASTTSLILWNEMHNNCGYERLGGIALSSCRISGVHNLVHHIIGEMEDALNMCGIYTDRCARDSEDPNVLENYHIV